MIRRADPADAPRLVEMTLRFLRTTSYAAVFPDPDPVNVRTLVDYVLEHGVIFVADYPMYTRVIDGDVVEQGDPYLVGMIAFTAPPHLFANEAYAEEQGWWVEPEHRGGTTGPRLMQAAEAWARENGLKMIKMVAPEGSDVGKFYTKLGYRAVETAYVKAL